MIAFAMKHIYLSKHLNLKIFKPFILLKVSNSQRSYASALYIPGSKANKTFSFLTPELNIDEYLKNVEKFKKNLDLRGLKVDVGELQKTWELYTYICSNKNILSDKLAEVSSHIGAIKKKQNLSSDEENEVKALEAQSRLVKQDLKVIKESMWDLQESFIPQLLKLPNEIDQQTPSKSSIVLNSIGEKTDIPESKRKNHLDIGKNLDLIEYRSPIQCYLYKEAVSFELGVIALAGTILNESGVMRIAGPDFCRSIVVEGSGMDHESSTETYILKNTDNVEEEYLVNQMHLVGGASLPALLATFTKQRMKLNELPVKVFTTGRVYTPFSNASTAYGLFSISQASCVNALTLVKCKDTEEYKNEFENLIDITSKIYDQIGCHYRTVIRSAKELNTAESIRVSFEMWSTYSNQYIEVGHISAYGDYFSKRLLMIYQTANRSGYLGAVFGNLLSVPKILGCLLEENPERFTIPKAVAKFAPFNDSTEI